MNALTSNGLFGNLFADPEIASLFQSEAFLTHMLDFEAAWTEALAAVKLTNAHEIEHARQALMSFHADLSLLAKASERDGLPVPELVRQLKEHAGANAADAIHKGTTSQDVIDTAFVLILRKASAILSARLLHIEGRLKALNNRFGQLPLIGRTRMQAALPIQVCDRIAAWQQSVKAAHDALARAKPLVQKLQLGGPVGRLDMPNSEAMAVMVADRLGLKVASSWHNARAPIVEFGHVLTLIAGATGKIGQDIALMAQQEIDEIRIEGAGGSSAMPHKQNPVRAEILVALARFVAGHQGILGQALIHEQERSGAAWTLEWLTLPPMLEATGAALNNSVALLNQIQSIGKN